MDINLYEATSTFTLVTTRIVAHAALRHFVDGLQKVTFPSPPAIQATWLPAFAMTGLAPVSRRYPSLGTLIFKDSTPCIFCDFEKDKKFEEAVTEWRKVFGGDFPATIEKSISISEDARQPLADYSHCEPLRWPFSSKYRVGIDAYIYDSDKTKKFGGINSDGRSISKGLYLKFIANTNAGDNFQYYWQVVNTGEVARLSGGLRGELFLGNEVQWERTLYKGKHWVECFIVQNNTCVARSGKFFVNIT